MHHPLPVPLLWARRRLLGLDIVPNAVMNSDVKTSKSRTSLPLGTDLRGCWSCFICGKPPWVSVMATPGTLPQPWAGSLPTLTSSFSTLRATQPCEGGSMVSQRVFPVVGDAGTTRDAGHSCVHCKKCLLRSFAHGTLVLWVSLFGYELLRHSRVSHEALPHLSLDLRMSKALPGWMTQAITL